MNLADPDLELVDPTPNIHQLFVQFDKIFFWSKLNSCTAVRWSKRMYSCAGVCSYAGKSSLCDIALSEPLLKLRPRKDLVETLLHEMIHAYLFIVGRDRDRDGHGAIFQSHMRRINSAAGLNISIYHDFHDEVQLYQTHWWRCDGPCQKLRPHFGIVRRSANRAPGPNDYWWSSHTSNCGGTFIKIKEPEKNRRITSKKAAGDITKFIINNNDKGKTNTERSKTNNVTTKDSPEIRKPILFEGKGRNLSGQQIKSPPSGTVVDTVRNVWANKSIGTNSTTNTIEDVTRKVKEIWANKVISNKTPKVTKRPAIEPVNSPRAKVTKIDDYFKTKSVLKDIYGTDFDVYQNKDDKKMIAVQNTNAELVSCPICEIQVNCLSINMHIDECLNKVEIERISKDGKNGELENFQGLTNQEGMVSCSSTPIKIMDTDKKSPFQQHTKKLFKDDKALVIDDAIININSYTKITTVSSNPVVIVDETINKNTKQKQLFEDNNAILIDDEIISTTPTSKITTMTSNPIVMVEETINRCPSIKIEPSSSSNLIVIGKSPTIKIEPSTSKSTQKCPCCQHVIDKAIEQHLDECLAFFDNTDTIPEEGASTSHGNCSTIVVLDDEDDLDESATLNATGTKYPCPVCLKMVEQINMNQHLDECLMRA